MATFNHGYGYDLYRDTNTYIPRLRYNYRLNYFEKNDINQVRLFRSAFSKRRKQL